MTLKKLGGIAIFAFAAMSCGRETSSDEKVPAAEEFSFNEEAREALTAEASAIPAAMVVRVPVLADGTEDTSGAELRSTPAYSGSEGDLESVWASGSEASVPAADSRYLVVNPPSQQQLKTESPKSSNTFQAGKGKPRAASSLSDVTTSSGAIAIGRRGVVVSGNMTRISGGQGYSHNPYGYGYGSSRYNRGGSFGRGSSNHSSYSNPSDYYVNHYRPVYRSRYGYSGYGAYWGYYRRPYRVIRGGYCYYVYPRPVRNCGAYCTWR